MATRSVLSSSPPDNMKYFFALSFLIFMISNAVYQFSDWRFVAEDKVFFLGVFYWAILGVFIRKAGVTF
jgi:hypothetical protein